MVWEESPPVILRCAISFLLNHDDMILTCAFFSEIAGGLFHFKKDHAQYSLKPEDYANKPLFLASKENRFLNKFFLYILEDLHTCQSLGALQFTSDDPDFLQRAVECVYNLIPATATARRRRKKPHLCRRTTRMLQTRSSSRGTTTPPIPTTPRRRLRARRRGW